MKKCKLYEVRLVNWLAGFLRIELLFLLWGLADIESMRRTAF